VKAAEPNHEPIALKTAGEGDPSLGPGGRDILTAVGEVLYDWTLSDDRIRWGANALDILKVGAVDEIASGRRFAAFLDPANLSSRHEAVVNSVAKDEGAGVPYQVQYAFLPQKRAEGLLWIEDIGRWYGDATGRPVHAHGVIRVINERYEREQRLAYLSRYDELTGYFNRSQLLLTLGDAITTARRLREPVAFLLAAVDNFRAINTAYGYAIADQVFAGVARRIKGALREGDAIGRYSGNKLGLILMNCDETQMLSAAERFLATVREHVIDTDSGAVAATVSIGGVALPRHGNLVSDATAHVQEALELARERGAGRFVAYAISPERNAARRDNAVRSAELVTALNDRRIRLAFQPIIDIGTRQPLYHEALARLVRLDGSIVPAREFVPLSERLGLVRLLDYRSLELALGVLAAAPEAKLSLNVAVATTRDSEWLARLAATLTANRSVGERLTVEISESAVIDNIAETEAFIGFLHDLGCRVAIDDFGAGHTSFRNLKTLPVDIIKIDGAFIEGLSRSPENQLFVRALVDLAGNLGASTVAEWVNDEKSVDLLASYGVNTIQGNLAGAEFLGWPEDRAAAATR
jgi:diguanylate cyclase (GGDEF)-like protein